MKTTDNPKEATVFIYKDDDGELSLDKTNGNIRLILSSEGGRVRKIGCIARNNAGFISYYKEDREAEVFRKNDSWSINWNIMSFLPNPESTINIKTEKAIYRITKAQAEISGSFLYFKTVGIERKFYIPRSFFYQEAL